MSQLQTINTTVIKTIQELKQKRQEAILKLTKEKETFNLLSIQAQELALQISQINAKITTQTNVISRYDSLISDSESRYNKIVVEGESLLEKLNSDKKSIE